MPGVMDKIGTLFQNKDLLQFMLAFGADLVGNTGGKNTVAVGQRSLASDSFIKSLSEVLRNGGKVNMDGENASFKIPTSKLGGMTLFGGGSSTEKSIFGDTMGAGLTPQGGGGTQMVPAQRDLTARPPQEPARDMMDRTLDQPWLRDAIRGILNPPAGQSDNLADTLAGFSRSDLAGLSPEHITKMLEIKMMRDELGQKKLTDVADMIYKQGLLDYYKGQTDIGKFGAETRRMTEFRNLLSDIRGDSLDQKFFIPMSSGKLGTLREWNALPTEEQEYLIYADNARKSGESVMSRQEFKNLDPTDREAFLRAAMEDPKLMAAAKELAASGRTTITLTPDMMAERTLATGAARQQLDVTDPGYPQKIQEDISGDIQTRNQIMNEAEKLVEKYGMTFEDAEASVTRAQVLYRMDNGIRQSYRGKGTITYEKGVGWLLDGELIVRDPYAK